MMRSHFFRFMSMVLLLSLPLNLLAQTPTVQRQFVAAIRQGNLTQVKALLAKGAKVNVPKPPPVKKGEVRVPNGKMTPLIEAAKNGRANVVRFLIQRGARLEDEEGAGAMTALMYAKNYASVKALLDAGADPNTRNVDGEAVLLNWVSKSNPEAKRTTRLLLQKGAKADVGDMSGSSALMYAVTAGDISIVRLLLQKGARVTHVGDSEESPTGEDTALSIANRKKRSDIVRLLKQYGARK